MSRRSLPLPSRGRRGLPRGAPPCVPAARVSQQEVRSGVCHVTAGQGKREEAFFDCETLSDHLIIRILPVRTDCCREGISMEQLGKHGRWITSVQIFIGFQDHRANYFSSAFSWENIFSSGFLWKTFFRRGFPRTIFIFPQIQR